MYILITFHLTSFLEGFILYKIDTAIAHNYAMGNIYMQEQLPYEKF